MVLLRPLFHAAKNRIRNAESRGRLLFRDGILFTFAFFLMYSIFFGTTWILKSLAQLQTLAYLPASLPLALILLVLFVMLIISNIVSAVGAFYLGEDLDLILASPLMPRKFFFQRLILVMMSTSWMSLVFMAPVVGAYGILYEMGAEFYGTVVAALIPYFVIPAAIAYVCGTFLVVFVPLKRSKILFFLVILCFLGGIYFILDIFRLIWMASNQTSELMRLVKVFSAANIPWMPSTWVGDVMTSCLGIHSLDIGARLILLYGVAISSIALSYLVFLFFHTIAFSSMKNHRSGKKYSHQFLRRLTTSFDLDTRQWFAIIFKDLRLLSRDMSQLFQGVLLLGLYLIYIYNLRIFAGFYAVGPTDFWWRHFLFISNFCMSAFISSALCTRFVFPSISLEGRCFSLVIVKSPYTVERLVRGKFWFWYFIVAIVHSLVVATGAYASGATTMIVLVNVLCSWIMCYGLVGLAVGMGSTFARFDWESVSQLAVGFGNIVFILSASVLILVNMIPVWVIVFTWLPNIANRSTMMICLLAASFCTLNIVVNRVSLSRGIGTLIRN